MAGTKARFLDDLCAARGLGCVRFDYSGHGASSGRFEDGTIGAWAEDAIAVIDRVTDGPLVLVGSSMGGWIMLLTALARSERIRALVGIAAAPDFTEDLLWPELSESQREAILRDGEVTVPSDYDPRGYILTRKLFEDGRRNFVMREKVPLACPVRLLHGVQDPDVPWRTSLALAERLESEDVVVTLVKNGDHRLSTDEDLARLRRTIGELL